MLRTTLYKCQSHNSPDLWAWENSLRFLFMSFLSSGVIHGENLDRRLDIVGIDSHTAALSMSVKISANELMSLGSINADQGMR